MDMFDTLLERKLPKIKEAGYRVASPSSKKYNCIAWSTGRDDIWIWPIRFSWPSNIERNLNLSSFIDFYQSYGYDISEDDKFEEGYDKIAIYIHPDNGNVTHTTRQLESGKWTSKLGSYKDIEHSTLDSLIGCDYGIIAMIMKRKKEVKK